MKRHWKVKERQRKGSGRSRKVSDKAVEGQGKAVKRQWKINEKSWKYQLAPPTAGRRTGNRHAIKTPAAEARTQLLHAHSVASRQSSHLIAQP